MREKIEVINYCLSLVETKLLELKTQNNLIQQSANNETKSSAGDKYETARAMAQLEMDKLQRQIWEQEKIQQSLQNVLQYSNFELVRNGALLVCNQFSILIAASIGEIFYENTRYLILSSESPLAKKLMNLKAGDAFDFLNEKVEIKAIY